VATTTHFLADLLAEPRVREATHDTALVERIAMSWER
jgi:hypothetical protein